MFKPISFLEALYPPLFCRYIQGDEGIIHLFGEPSWEAATFRRRIQLLGDFKFPQGPREHLQELDRSLGRVSPQSTKNKKLNNRATVFVITGQQPGLFSGPLYVIYKALTAVKLAWELETSLGIPVQPLFWVAGEDHNIHDLARVFAPTPDGSPLKVSYKLPTFGLPSGMLPLKKEAVARALSRLEGAMADGPFQKTITARLEEASEGAQTFGDWFVRVMELLFHEKGLAYCDPLRMAQKGLYSELLLRLVDEGPRLHSLIDEREREMKAAGLPVQVERTGSESFIMMVWQGKRFQLFREKDSFRSRKGEPSFSRKELCKRIREEPERFGPNVLLRPIFQDCLFPSLAYVPGPSELNYFAQIQDIYRVFEIQAPPLYPRTGVTVIEPAIKGLLDEAGLTLEDLFLLAAEGKKVSADALRLPAPEAEKLRLNIFPRGHPQERKMNIFPYLARYGFSFWEEFASRFPLSMGHYAYYWE